ncbi:MAG: ABC transporter permease subunit [Opitutaceae bacterium]|nr:ABC transporter permease subunit [Opitutaceae bacterium]
MTGFLLTALVFVGLLTAVVRFAGLQVRRDIGRRKELALSLGFVALVLFGWWFVTRGDYNVRLVNSTILPAPLEVLKAFVPLHFDQGLVRNALVSVQRIAFAFSIAVFVAVPLGTCRGSIRPIAALFHPVTLVGTYVPTVVFLPLSIGWFGATEIQKVWFLAVVYFIAVLPLVIKSVGDVPSAFLDVAVTKGATQWQLVRHVLFPVAKADIWDHLRGAFGVGWTWIILAEAWANAERGLGYLLEISYRRTRIDRYFAVVIVIVLIAVVCDQLWRIGGRLLFPYRNRQ